MRDDLDYLYDTFALDADASVDADTTVTYHQQIGLGGYSGTEIREASSWNLLPAPSFRRPYEGLQIEEGCLIMTPTKGMRKEPKLRRVT